MVRWAEFETAEPDFASEAWSRFDAIRHLTMATLRSDGSPRISGVELQLIDGDLWIGSMPDSRKSADLRKDPRFAIHSGSTDPKSWTGDAKLSGRAVESNDPAMKAAVTARSEEDPGPFDLFRVEIDEVVLIGLNETADALQIEIWRPGQSIQRTNRT